MTENTYCLPVVHPLGKRCAVINPEESRMRVEGCHHGPVYLDSWESADFVHLKLGWRLLKKKHVPGAVWQARK